MLETGGWQGTETHGWKALERSEDQRLQSLVQELAQAPPSGPQARSLTPRTPGLSYYMPVKICSPRLGRLLCGKCRPSAFFL